VAKKSTVDASMVWSLADEANASPESFSTNRRATLVTDNGLGVGND
jgi:hypothetical protein